ncbi:MAG: methionine--tRNA ligase, partial [Chloroflexota bacterium]|nr:methionine--tRNA ligase [Chloroflexota bacterium]
AVWTMLQALNGLKLLFAPYTPFSSQRLHELLGFTGDVNACGWAPDRVPAGQSLPAPTPLFAKFDSPA